MTKTIAGVPHFQALCRVCHLPVWTKDTLAARRLAEAGEYVCDTDNGQLTHDVLIGPRDRAAQYQRRQYHGQLGFRYDVQ